MCNHDCFNCQNPDCDNEEITLDEIKAQDQFDRLVVNERKYGKARKLWLYEISLKGRLRRSRYIKSAKGKETLRKYAQSAKGREAAKRYAQSEKGKENYKRYMQSEKGKAAAKRKQEKRIANGKNAEYCRRYYRRKKEKTECGVCIVVD